MKGFVIIMLVLLMSSMVMGQTPVAPAAGDGTEGSQYQIATWQNLYWISQNTGSWDKYFEQTDDISFPYDISGWDSGKGWTPIGNSSTSFTGQYDGAGYKISGLVINRPTTDGIGLFGYVADTGTIKNLGVEIGEAGVTGHQYVGGLVGTFGAVSGIIENCFTTGNVSGYRRVGGFVGNFENGDIQNCYATGNVTSLSNAGGFVGYVHSRTVQNCYARGDVTRSSGEGTNFGGFCGKNYKGKILKSYSTGSVKYGETIQTDIGFCGSVDTIGKYEMSGNFWDTETSGADSTAGGATGKNTAEMTTDALAYNYTTNIYLAAGWDFKGEATNGTNEIWNIGNNRNDGYPYLDWQYPEDDASLPVELTAFTAKSQSGAVILSWTTESETENLGFIIERKIVGANHDLPNQWSQIASYVTDKALTGHGSTSQKHEYQYTDKAVQPGATYLYHLADVDYSGKVTWHPAVEVRVEAGELLLPLVFGLQPAYPNPFNPALTIPYGLIEDGQVSLKVYNLRGELVEVLMNTYTLKGAYSYTWQPVNLSAGIYFIQLQSGNKTNLQKVVFVK